MKLRYAVVYEAGTQNLSAYASDLPGCVATGRTLDKIRQNMREAMTLHLDLMREHGEPFPRPTTSAGEGILESPAIAEFIEVDTSPGALARDIGRISRDVRQIA